VVEGSGSDELTGIEGTVRFEEGHKEEYNVDFDYEL